MQPLSQNSAKDSPPESVYFAKIRDACRANDARAALESLLVWLGISCEGRREISVRQFAAEVGDDDLAAQLVRLREVTDSADWSGAELYCAVDRVRRKLREDATASE
jgi:hypothetical protein